MDTENPNLTPTAPFTRTTKEYLVEAGEALYMEKNPKAKDLPAVTLAPNGKIVALTEGGPTEWFTELQVKEHHLRIAAKAVDKLLLLLAEKVPSQFHSHQWYKDAMVAMVDIQAFPSLPK